MLTYTIVRVTYHPAGRRGGEGGGRGGRREEGGEGGGRREEREEGRGGRREEREEGREEREEGREEREEGREGEEGGGGGEGGGKGGEMTVVHTHFLVHTVILTWGMWFGTETGYQMRDKHKLYKHRVKIQDMKVANKYV